MTKEADDLKVNAIANELKPQKENLGSLYALRIGTTPHSARKNTNEVTVALVPVKVFNEIHHAVLVGYGDIAKLRAQSDYKRCPAIQEVLADLNAKMRQVIRTSAVRMMKYCVENDQTSTNCLHCNGKFTFGGVQFPYMEHINIGGGQLISIESFDTLATK